MTIYQGKLDGLCGPYAIVNAFRACVSVDPEVIFEAACSALPLSHWPEGIWEGTGYLQMQKMVKACRESIDSLSLVSISYPFNRKTPKTNEEYWSRFDKIFDNIRNTCVIMGQTQPNAHWIVAKREGERLLFTDTDPKKFSFRKNRSSIFAGDRRKYPSQWLVARRELIVFSI